MKSRIPPLHALAALDAFARLGTVWEAAEDLGITRSAVSHHIASFQAEYPNLCLQIVTCRELDEAADRDVDLFIAFGAGNWPKHTVQHLYDVEFLPMCSPVLQNMQGGLNHPADVLRFPLLHLQKWDDWQQWLAAGGVEFSRRGAGITFSDMMLVQTAAIAGQGIMMGDKITCGGALANGQLVTPFSTKIKARGGYYLLRNRQKRPNPAMLAFTRWLNALFTRIGTEVKGSAF